VSIRLGYEDLCGNDVLTLTNLQVNRMTKAYQDGKGITIKMRKRQVVHIMKTEGGFLSFLAGLAAKALPFLAKTILPTSGGSWWNWPGGLRNFISGWTYGIHCCPGCFYNIVAFPVTPAVQTLSNFSVVLIDT